LICVQSAHSKRSGFKVGTFRNVAPGNARPQFLPPNTPQWRKILVWSGVLATGAALGLALLLISAFAVNKIFPPSDAPLPHQSQKGAHHPGSPIAPGK
jgi:hypothetical protein